MTEEKKDKLVVPTSTSTKMSVGGRTSLHQRVATAPSLTTARERIALLLDTSGSMASVDGSYGFDLDNTHKNEKTKIELLKQAVEAFVQTCGADVALALLTFPEQAVINMTLSRALVILETHNLSAGGGTPMGDAMRDALKQQPSRCVLVSDGDATDGGLCHEQAREYARQEPKVPCDCVHIGTSAGGEDTLKQIAETTGGVYLKFEDVTKLVGGLKYLTPAFRAMLTSGSIDAAQLGAKEVTK